MSGRTSPRIVINADDLGRSDNVNRAVLDAFHRGLITSASMMANVPGFEDAVAAIMASAIQDRIGVHLNLTQGAPLSIPIRHLPRFCSPSGELNPRGATLWRLSPDEDQAIETEFAAQIDAVIARGIRPSHLDSHQHFHTQWPISPILIRLARRYGVPAVRLSRNCGPSPGIVKRLYKTAFNARLTRAGLAPTRHFGSAQDAASLTHFAGAIEIMVHPELDGDGHVVDVLTAGGVEGAEPLEPVASAWRQIGPLVSFRELCAT